MRTYSVECLCSRQQRNTELAEAVMLKIPLHQNSCVIQTVCRFVSRLWCVKETIRIPQPPERWRRCIIGLLQRVIGHRRPLCV